MNEKGKRTTDSSIDHSSYYYPWNSIELPHAPAPTPANINVTVSSSDRNSNAIKAMIREVVKEELADLKKNLVNDVLNEINKRIRTQGGRNTPRLTSTSN